MTESYITAELRRAVVARASGCCEYCRVPASFSPQSHSIDHILPRKLGGAPRLDNLALCCQGCNGHKATRLAVTDPLTLQEVLLFNPRQQRWREHFAWSEDFTEIVGITPTGRATVVALRLNRQGLVNLRRVLFAQREHPPQSF